MLKDLQAIKSPLGWVLSPRHNTYGCHVASYQVSTLIQVVMVHVDHFGKPFMASCMDITHLASDIAFSN